MNNPTHARLLGQATSALATRLAKPVQWQPHAKQAPYFHLLVGGQTLTAYLLPHLPTSIRTPLTARSEVLLTTYLPAAQALALQQQGQQYLDGAGNAFLQTPHYFVCVQRQPRPVSVSPPATPLPNEWQPASLRLLYYLLSEPELLQAPYRVMSERAGVSLGSIATFFAKAYQLRLLRAETKGQRQWVNSKLALQRWVQGYAQVLRPTLVPQRYRWSVAPDSRWRHLPVPTGACWGGEPAAQLLLKERHLTPDSFTLHCAGTLPDWGLLPEPLSGTVELLLPPFPLPRKGSVAPALLVYTDLVLLGQQERAQQVLAQELPHLA